MYRNILIATDGSNLSARAVKHGVSLAATMGARVTAVNISMPFHWFDPNMVAGAEDAYSEAVGQDAAIALATVTDAANAAGLACETVHIEEEHPYKAIVDTAKARNCDLIVMASHRRKGMSALFLGSETVNVLTHCEIPILVCN
jgi:nucleotide-binding universal stress UspA family protein